MSWVVIPITRWLHVSQTKMPMTVYRPIGMPSTENVNIRRFQRDLADERGMRDLDAIRRAGPSGLKLSWRPSGVTSRPFGPRVVLLGPECRVIGNLTPQKTNRGYVHSALFLFRPSHNDVKWREGCSKWREVYNWISNKWHSRIMDGNQCSRNEC